ncbi:MAG: nicotinate phosphoribosyltransferase [Thermoplasmata archaeon]
MERFHAASEADILAGRTTDIYFERAKEILQKEGKDREPVVAEFTAGGLPQGWEWGVFCGLDEVVNLMEGRSVDLYALPEGTIFNPRSHNGVRVPVMVLEGPYGEFCVYETPLLGLICQATAIASKASRVRKAARDKEVISFGIRRMHPAMSPMIDRAAFIGGLDAVSSLTGADAIGRPPSGTMPHALTIVLGSPEAAFKAFDAHTAKEVRRITLVDTYSDEVAESLMACQAVPNLYGVRLDTPSSRKGNFAEIVRQVRWELDVRGYKDVKIFVSGGLDENSIRELAAAGADGFGVGTSISNAPTVNFSMDLVEVAGRPAAKRGKYSGRKEVFRCKEDLTYAVGLEAPHCPVCGGDMSSMLAQYIKHGKRTRELPGPDRIREYVLQQLDRASFSSS